MSGSVDTEVIEEALAVIDKGLHHFLHRELVSTSEATDLLLDVRSLLSGALGDLEVESLEPVGN